MVRSPLSKHSLIPSALACVALLSLQACPDPAGQYDDFEGRAEGFKSEGPRGWFSLASAIRYSRFSR